MDFLIFNLLPVNGCFLCQIWHQQHEEGCFCFTDVMPDPEGTMKQNNISIETGEKWGLV